MDSQPSESVYYDSICVGKVGCSSSELELSTSKLGNTILGSSCSLNMIMLASLILWHSISLYSPLFVFHSFSCFLPHPLPPFFVNKSSPYLPPFFGNKLSPYLSTIFFFFSFHFFGTVVNSFGLHCSHHSTSCYFTWFL